MGVDNGREVDGLILDCLLKHRRNSERARPASASIPLLLRIPYRAHSLIGVGRVDDHRVLGFVINHEVGVVVAFAHP